MWRGAGGPDTPPGQAAGLGASLQGPEQGCGSCWSALPRVESQKAHGAAGEAPGVNGFEDGLRGLGVGRGSSGSGGRRQLAGRSPFPRLRLASRRPAGGAVERVGAVAWTPRAQMQGGGSSGWRWRRVLQAGAPAGRLRRPPLSSRFAGTASAGASTCTDPGTAPPGATATGYVGPGHSPPAARQQPSGLERCAGRACRHPPPAPAPGPETDRGPRLAPWGRQELPGPPEAGTVGDLLGVRAGGHMGRTVRCEASSSEV